MTIPGPGIKFTNMSILFKTNFYKTLAVETFNNIAVQL